MGSTGASLVRALLFASLFAGFAADLAAGEKDCYDERDSVIRMCKWTIKKGSPYVIPDMPCRLEVRKVDMLDGVTILRSEKVKDEIVLDGNAIAHQEEEGGG